MSLFNRQKATVKNAWLAINVDSDGYRAASVARSPGAMPAVTQCVFHPSGEAEAGALERVAREVQAARYRCTTLLQAGQYQLVSADAPNVPDAEMKTAVRWKLKDLIDFPVDQATIDVLPLPAAQGGQGRPASVFAVAARNDFVRARQELFAGAKVRLRAIDLPELAQRNIGALAETSGRALAMLHFGEGSGLLTVTFDGELCLSRRIEVGIATLGDPSEMTRSSAYDRITLELQRSLDHFDRQFHTMPLAKLLLGPLGAAGAPLLAYLAANLYVPVGQMALAEVLDLSAVPQLSDPELQHRMFLTLGAALREEVA
jgi:MSHA biogenesis protein MshI